MVDAPSFPCGLVILGSGGHARVVADAALLMGWSITGHIGPVPGKVPEIGPYLGADEEIAGLSRQGKAFALGFGFVNAAGAVRRAEVLAHLLDMQVALPVIRHSAAVVSASARIDAGAFIAAGAIVSSGAVIGAGAILNTASAVDHGSRIGANTHVATGSLLAGDVVVGENVLLGIGCVVRQGLHVGPRAVVGAGAVVLNNVPGGATVIGCPAR